MSPEQHGKLVIDGVTATAGLTSGYWYEHVQALGTEFLLWGAVALLILRLLIAWREWRRGK